MAVSKSPLGMNARNFLYLRKYNKASAKRLADDKLLTKQILIENDISTAKIIEVFEDRLSVRNANWSKMPETFVIKPSHGYGGEGILLIADWDGFEGVNMNGETFTISDLESHIYDTLEGAFSLQSVPDTAFIEERLTPQRFFKKVLAFGMPDIRIIACNGIPIMAMLRVPTEQSGGKANVHQGAIAVGVDIATGVTTFATLRNKPLRFFPNTKVKPHGLRVPHWDEILSLAVRAQTAIGLGYIGVDIVIDAKYGPVILEVNARPGLAIQNANDTSLRTRLERVDGMQHPTKDRGIGIARTLFAEPFSDKVRNDEPIIIGIIEQVKVIHDKGEHATQAKIDTGAFRTSIDENLARMLRLKKSNERVRVRSASGRQHRNTVEIVFNLGGRTITTVASTVNRKHLSFPMIIGRRDLDGFLVDPTLNTFNEAIQNTD